MVQPKQLPLPMPKPSENGKLGLDAQDCQPQLATDVFKELVNKISWAVGSTYRQSYSNTRSNVRHVSRLIAVRLITEHGYPASIALK